MCPPTPLWLIVSKMSSNSPSHFKITSKIIQPKPLKFCRPPLVECVRVKFYCDVTCRVPIKFLMEIQILNAIICYTCCIPSSSKLHYGFFVWMFGWIFCLQQDLFAPFLCIVTELQRRFDKDLGGWLRKESINRLGSNIKWSSPL